MIDTNTLRFEARLNKLDNSQMVLSPLVVGELLDRLEAAEKERDALCAEVNVWRRQAEAYWAKIEQMERQEPIAWGAFYFGGKLNGKLYSQCDTEAQIDMYIADRHQSDDSNTFRKAPLYALPGAQPAPSVPSGLHPLETVRFWADAYTHPGDDNFRGHGMAAALLREYAELRAALAPEAKP